MNTYTDLRSGVKVRSIYLVGCIYHVWQSSRIPKIVGIEGTVFEFQTDTEPAQP